ncbi:hypothetical protein CHS0354_037962 [Potamilus streckersoni]|uniref:Sorting nexin-27 n=1 Tax=Potamilus streckersoni TaxID=2493646 RepID=A0AAE0WAI4_9BIVA|nr:hypothetical protein CHS0354_037962 [Potamilus streckersoni]
MADSDDSGTPSPAEYQGEDPFSPRVVMITKSETGFGFNVRGQVSEGGVLKSINGVLYAPLQHVSAVLEGGAAQRAGIRKGDRILAVNNVTVEGATHKQVVDLIKSGGDTLTLTETCPINKFSKCKNYTARKDKHELCVVCTKCPLLPLAVCTVCVISVPEQVADRLEPSDDSSGPSYVDFSERRSLPISIPDCQTIDRNGEKFVVFNIYMAGRHLCSRRYREFSAIHSQLKQEFPDFNFPKLPPKKFFSLTDQQLDARRRGLEQYLEKVCAVRVIGECDLMQEFLASGESDHSTANNEVELKVMLPDKSICVITIHRNDTTDTVYKAIVQKLKLSDAARECFYLFETVEYNFERKLHASEFPHNIYIQNYSTATATCIMLKKWLFNPVKENFLNSDDQAVTFFFWQAVEDVNRGHIKTDEKLYELRALQESEKKMELLKTVRHLDGYGCIVFPHCPCDSRKEGHVIAIVSYKCFTLQACRNDGTIESQVIEFQWKDIKAYDIDDEGMAFAFEYDRPGKKPRMVQVLTQYYVYLKECFDKVYQEMNADEEKVR